MHADKNRLNELSGNVIGCTFTVRHTLGAEFPGKVHDNALAHELGNAGYAVARRYGATLIYDGAVVGAHCVDLLVEDMLLVELQTVKASEDADRAQCVSHLKATGLLHCLLLNFGKPRLAIKRLASRRCCIPLHLRASACIC